ncbi:hypothetical protein LAJ55_13500, partial [Streptococcus pneumoniae]|uniref:hypothetical protein n=1 Tax=Streptococcus pneumoniae TaxID=1313 RepID=UPI001CC11CCE
ISSTRDEVAEDYRGGNFAENLFKRGRRNTADRARVEIADNQVEIDKMRIENAPSQIAMRRFARANTNKLKGLEDANFKADNYKLFGLSKEEG